MRFAKLLFATLLASALTAQEQTGRHFQRPERAVATPAASAAVDAAAKTQSVRVAPLPKLRSGRAWSAHHFSRRAEAPATEPKPTAVEASKGPETRRTAFWGRRVRSV